MNEIGKFLVENWQPITGAILAFVGVLITLLKKRPVVRSFTQIIEFICNCIPNFINEAEATGMSGSRKFSNVLGQCMSLLHRLCVCNEEDDKFARTIFSNTIEEVLSTPQKKVIK